MLFTSFSFLILFIVTFILYYLPVFKAVQIYVLIISSFIFYAYHVPMLLLLLIFSPMVNILTSYYITYGNVKYRKLIAIVGLFTELAVLIFFKYSPLISKSFFTENSSIGYFLIMIPLPIGISFFTFEGISLVVDVYTQKYFDRKKYVSTSLIQHAKNIYCFISFFPHLIAGPIVKAHDFLPQIGYKDFRKIDWDLCFRYLVLGYFLKTVIADNLNQFTFWIAYPYYEAFSSLTLLALLFGYSIQIFADFAGYSLIAVGLAALMGYRLMENFNFPYISSSISEFWKRWHISLSSFLMEYLYYPLGGNRKGKVRTYINLFVTMVLGGLWHGAAWSYAVWGAFHGILLASERAIFGKRSHEVINSRRIIAIPIVFALVSMGWLLFKLPNFSDVIGFCKSVLLNIDKQHNALFMEYIFIYSIPVFLYHLHYLLKINHTYIQIANKFKWFIYGVMSFSILLNSGISGDFIYFQF